MPAASSAVISDARSVLDRIHDGLKQLAEKGLHTYLEPDRWALQKAARVLAAGASKAERLASEAGDAAASEIKKIADEAWQVSAGPLLLLALAYLAWKT
jgi:hypothetical protein